jgi:hypothetical protein
MVGIVDIDELAHALSVIFGRASRGHFDLAPRPVHIEADEEIEGAVAAVLEIVAFELARLGRNGLAHLADELDRALVEADHRPLGVGCFGPRVRPIAGPNLPPLVLHAIGAH